MTSGAATPAPIAVTMGEPAGIGAEVLLKTWRSRKSFGLPPFFVLDDPDRLTAQSDAMGLGVPVCSISAPEEALERFNDALPVLPTLLASPVEPGTPDPANTKAILASIQQAVEFARQGLASAVVTSPVHKRTLYDGGFDAPGHTEYLGQLTGSTQPPVMLLACPKLRVVPVSTHIPLREAVANLSTQTIVTTGKICARALAEDFGVQSPRIAVAGLNPHAGEDGALGDEDEAIIAPAVQALRDLGIDATGPYPPDGMFHEEARQTYDLALCMYHDQALIPLKTLDFLHGVNVTLGLSIVRTSPDHGVAFGLAGLGRAHPDSFIAAIVAAADIAAHRAGGFGAQIPRSTHAAA